MANQSDPQKQIHNQHLEDQQHPETHESSDGEIEPWPYANQFKPHVENRSDGATKQRHILRLQRVGGNRMVQRALESHQVEQGSDEKSREMLEHAKALSGQPLPPDLKAKFEDSLGADLNNVRVHTGHESIEAARLINGRAYTEGADIHFERGQYAPDTHEGENMLAHEVTHTLQQASGENASEKIDITTPDHWSEQEAHRAASRMTQGAPAAVSPFSGVGRMIMRETNPADLKKAADAAEKEDKTTDMAFSSGVNAAVLTATNIGDEKAAEAEMQKIKDAEPKLVEATGAWLSGVDSGKLADNKSALSILGEYAAQGGIQTTAMSNFQQQYQRLMMDYDRLNAMVSLIGVSGEGTGGTVAEALVNTQHLTDADRKRISGDTNDPDKPASSVLSDKKSSMRDWQDKMNSASQDMGTNEKEMTGKSLDFQAKVNDIAAGLTPRKEPEAATALKELNDKLEKIKGYAKTMTGWATKALGGYLGTAAGGAVEGALGAMDVSMLQGKEKDYGEKAKKSVEDKAPELANDFVGWVVTLPWKGDLNLAQAKAKAALEDQTYQATQQKLNELEGRRKDVEIATSNYLKTATQLQHSKVMVRRVMIEIGQVADKSGGGKGHKWQTLATFLGEVEAYLAQSRATIGVGNEEKETADLAASQRKNIALGTGKDEVHWWTAVLEKNVSNDNEHWVVYKHLVSLPAGAKAKSAQGGGSGDYGANAIIYDELQRLETHSKWLTDMRDRLSKEFSGLEVEG